MPFLPAATDISIGSSDVSNRGGDECLWSEDVLSASVAFPPQTCRSYFPCTCCDYLSIQYAAFVINASCTVLILASYFPTTQFVRYVCRLCTNVFALPVPGERGVADRVNSSQHAVVSPLHFIFFAFSLHMFPLLMLPQCACFPLRLLLQIVRSVSSVVTDEQSLPRPAALLRLRDRRFHLLLHAAGSDPVCKRIHQRKYMPGERLQINVIEG